VLLNEHRLKGASLVIFFHCLKDLRGERHD
jgi:hypothetical protein